MNDLSQRQRKQGFHAAIHVPWFNWSVQINIDYETWFMNCFHEDRNYPDLHVACCVDSVEIQIKHKKVRVLPIRILNSIVSSVGPCFFSLWRRANARNVRLYYSYRQYTNLFIFLSKKGICIDLVLELKFFWISCRITMSQGPIYMLIVCMTKLLHSDWLRGVQLLY